MKVRFLENSYWGVLGRRIGNLIGEIWVSNCAGYLLVVLASSPPLYICFVRLGLELCEIHFPDSLASWIPVGFWQSETLGEEL